jgi:hypothetical protein
MLLARSFVGRCLRVYTFPKCGGLVQRGGITVSKPCRDPSTGGPADSATIRARDRAAYTFAAEYLLRFAPEGVTPALLEGYLHPTETWDRPGTLAEIYAQLLVSAQGGGMGPTVIGAAIGGIEQLGPLLCGFDPAAVVAKYRGGWSHVLDDIEETLRPSGKIRRASRSTWPLFCQAVLSGAAFLQRFSDGDDFHGWVRRFDGDERSRPALPLILSREIRGLGFALACGFLMGLGYRTFAKPDVHLKAIFKGLELCDEGADDYHVFKAITRVARNQDVLPYAVDKLFWLIGSGRL